MRLKNIEVVTPSSPSNTAALIFTRIEASLSLFSWLCFITASCHMGKKGLKLKEGHRFA